MAVSAWTGTGQQIGLILKMTFLHGAACAVFCFGPPLAIYKATNLSDQSGTLWLLSLASIFYLLNLFAKSLLVASFLPATCESSFFCSVVIDLITALMEINTIRYFLSHKTSLSYSAETRLLCIGLGWTVGHTICANANLLLRAIGSVAFHWVDIYYAIQASVAPMCYLSATTLTFMASRRRMSRTAQIAFLAIAALLVPGTLIQKHLLGLMEPPSRFLEDKITLLCWIVLLVHAAVAASAGAATYVSFRTGQRQAHVHKIE